MARDPDTFLAEMKGEQTVHAIYAGIRDFDSQGGDLQPDAATSQPATSQVNTRLHPCKMR